jgi:hypothetical protein
MGLFQCCIKTFTGINEKYFPHYVIGLKKTGTTKAKKLKLPCIIGQSTAGSKIYVFFGGNILQGPDLWKWFHYPLYF